ncbi:MAG: uL30 family ribosomal protein [Candidatus Micrarchaeota archaeon]|nr:uL30 family ribosomal protein [Candidatus Micrarchaeota archaeon]
MEKKELYAVIRIRGRRKLNKKIDHTLKMLNIYKPNYCSLFFLTKAYEGMLKKAKDYISWGKISKELLFKLLLKRGESGKKKLSTLKSEEEIKKIANEIFEGKNPKEFGIKPTFRLKPPSKGYKNKKKHYPYGELGPRPSIDSLLKRMI